MELSNVHAELVALIENPLTTFFNEGIKSSGELCHAVAQVIEAKVDIGQLVCDRGANRGHALSHTCGKGGLEISSHREQF